MGRGKLVFKGEEKKAKKAKKSSAKKRAPDAVVDNDVARASAEDTQQQQQQLSEVTASHDIAVASSAKISGEDQQMAAPKVTTGQGLISTSGTVVSGHGTSFQSQLRIGDAILARVGSGDKTREEMRIITMVLSRISVSISSAFSTDLKTPSPYTFINKPRDIQKERAKKSQLAKEEQEAVERQAMGTYMGDGKGEVVYREKTVNGGYRIRREKTENVDMTRSDLLTVRAKKKSDRYC